MRKHNLQNQAIEIVAQALETDGPATLESSSGMELVGFGMSRRCADEVFRMAGFKNAEKGEGRDRVGVAEVHDCFAANEVRGLRYKLLLHCGPE